MQAGIFVQKLLLASRYLGGLGLVEVRVECIKVFAVQVILGYA